MRVCLLDHRVRSADDGGTCAADGEVLKPRNGMSAALPGNIAALFGERESVDFRLSCAVFW